MGSIGARSTSEVGLAGSTERVEDQGVSRHLTTKLSEVWVVQHDESPDNTVLGVFATQDEARVFMDEVKEGFKNGVICSAFPVGYRYTDGASSYSGGDPGLSWRSRR